MPPQPPAAAPADPALRPIPARYLHSLLRLARAQGCDIDALGSAAGLPLRALAAGDQDLPAQSYARLYHQMARLLDDECFGFYPERPMPLGSMAMLCQLLLAAPHLEAAVKTGARFFRLCEQLRGHPLPRFRALQRDTGLAWICHPPVAAVDVSDVFSLQNGLAGALSSWHRLLGWLVGQPLPLVEVRLRGPRSVRLDKFERIFRCPIRFDAPCDALGVNASWLRAPVIQNAAGLAHFLPMAPYHLVGLREIDATRPLELAERVQRLLRQDVPQRAPGLERIAARLGLSARSLRRQLADAGTSYQRIKDQCRRDAACHYLTHSDLAAAAVAALVGFDEPSAFHRAFRRWTGLTPGQYRALRAGGHAGLPLP